MNAPKRRAHFYEGTSAIYFSCKMGFYFMLSNFYVYVEFSHQATKFYTTSVMHVFLTDRARPDVTPLRRDEFISLLKQMQPRKKWTPEKEDYWFSPHGQPIEGIIAKLLALVTRSKVDWVARVNAVYDYVRRPDLRVKGGDKAYKKWKDENVRPEDGNEQVIMNMKRSLRVKYEREPCRSLLLSTGDKPLHEASSRGKPNKWTHSPTPNKEGYSGGDLLGRLLVEVRSEIQHSELEAMHGGPLDVARGDEARAPQSTSD